MAGPASGGDAAAAAWMVVMDLVSGTAAASIIGTAGRGQPAARGRARMIPMNVRDKPLSAVIRVLITAIALFVATAVVPGIELTTGSTLSKVLTLIVVALIFGIVNAILKPIAKTIGCLFYVLTLGLIGLVVNGLLLWLTSWVAGKLSLPFHVTGFWAAFWGAIIVGVVGWLLNMFVGDRGIASKASS
jgi:putative membrane protein